MGLALVHFQKYWLLKGIIKGKSSRSIDDTLLFVVKVEGKLAYLYLVKV